MTDRVLGAFVAGSFLGAAVIATLAIMFPVTSTHTVVAHETRTHGLIPQPTMSGTNQYPQSGVTVECDSWSNRPLHFNVGARPGDAVLTICSASVYKPQPVG